MKLASYFSTENAVFLKTGEPRHEVRQPTVGQDDRVGDGVRCR